jgi:hypothetical protein
LQLLRAANFEALRALLDAGIDLDAKGTHPELGEDAGPWSACLPVLRDR